MLEVNICTFVVLFELSDFGAEVLVEGPVSSGVMEGKYCIEIRLFFGWVRRIKSQTSLRKTKPTQPIFYRPGFCEEFNLIKKTF